MDGERGDGLQHAVPVESRARSRQGLPASIHFSSRGPVPPRAAAARTARSSAAESATASNSPRLSRIAPTCRANSARRAGGRRRAGTRGTCTPGKSCCIEWTAPGAARSVPSGESRRPWHTAGGPTLGSPFPGSPSPSPSAVTAGGLSQTKAAPWRFRSEKNFRGEAGARGRGVGGESQGPGPRTPPEAPPTP